MPETSKRHSGLISAEPGTPQEVLDAAEAVRALVQGEIDGLMAENKRLEEQLEAAQQELRSIYERCQRCDSTIGIEQARELGRENFCTVCWDAPILRRPASSPASEPAL